LVVVCLDDCSIIRYLMLAVVVGLFLVRSAYL
jgi:hypothetical protein